MKYAGCFITAALILCLPMTGFAQSMSDLEAKEAALAAERKRQAEERRILEAHREKMEKGGTASAATERFPVTLWLESQLPGREKKRLAVQPEEQKKYEALLHQPNTGLFKLVAVGKRIVAVSELEADYGVIPMRGGGSFYSFTKHRHDADEWAQIRLLNGQLQAGLSTQIRVMSLNSEMTSTVNFTPDGLTAFVMPENLPLEQVSAETPGVEFLNNLLPPAEFTELAELIKKLNGGIRVGSFTYQSSIPVKLDTTCVVRSVLYNKSDLVIAFRVVRQDGDGSLHLLWKLLKSFPPPALKGRLSKKS